MKTRKVPLPTACRRVMAYGHDHDRTLPCPFCRKGSDGFMLCEVAVNVPEGKWPPPPGGWPEFRGDPTLFEDGWAPHPRRPIATVPTDLL